MDENFFRIALAVILVIGFGISAYFRRKADKASGEKLLRKVDSFPSFLERDKK